MNNPLISGWEELFPDGYMASWQEINSLWHKHLLHPAGATSVHKISVSGSQETLKHFIICVTIER